MARHLQLPTLAVAVGCALWLVPAAALAQADDILDHVGDAKPAQPTREASAAAEPAPRATGGVRAASAATALTQREGDGPAPASLDRIKAVPRKTLLKRHRFELTPFGTMSLNDAYYEHLAVGGTLVFYPHDSFGIGIGAEYLMAHLETDNIEAMRQNFKSVPAVFEPPHLFAHVDAYFIPIYGKLSLFSSDIIQFDTYAVAGAGAAFAGEHRRPEANIGLGQRLLLGEWLAVRLELRDHLFVDTQVVDGLTRSGIQSYLLFMAGVSVFLPTSFEYSFQ